MIWLSNLWNYLMDEDHKKELRDEIYELLNEILIRGDDYKRRGRKGTANDFYSLLTNVNRINNKVKAL